MKIWKTQIFASALLMVESPIERKKQAKQEET